MEKDKYKTHFDILEYIIIEACKKGICYKQIDDSANYNSTVTLKRIYPNKSSEKINFCNAYEAASSIIARANLEYLKQDVVDHFITKYISTNSKKSATLSSEIYNNILTYVNSTEHDKINPKGIQEVICKNIRRNKHISGINLNEQLSDATRMINDYLQVNFEPIEHSSFMRQLKKVGDNIQDNGCWSDNTK